MAKRRKFSAEFKARVGLQVLSGEKTSAETCREHRLSAQQLSSWKRQFLENAPVVFENGRKQDEKEEQIAELGRMVALPCSSLPAQALTGRRSKRVISSSTRRRFRTCSSRSAWVRNLLRAL